MKAGTAQKVALHSFSTAVLIRLGHTYGNLMVDVAPNNAKLRARQVSILETATGAAEDECRSALAAADGDLRVALVTVLAGTTGAEARHRLAANGNSVRAALRA
jgi:N-acetylmuramic acid 6-phosphate etherase